MNIDRIISESINRFILREVDEARRGSIYDMEGGSSSTKIFKNNGDVLQFGSDASGRTKKPLMRLPIGQKGHTPRDQDQKIWLAHVKWMSYQDHKKLNTFLGF